MQTSPAQTFDDNVDPSAADTDPAPDAATAAPPQETSSLANMSLIRDIEVRLSMEIGQTLISIETLLSLSTGSVIELERLADEPLDVLVNGTLVAHGEAVVVGDRFGIRLTDVVSRADRIGKLT